MSLNCPQAVSKLKAYQKQHQDLKQQFSDLMSQAPFLPDIKWDEPFMSLPYYKDITNAPKDIFDNLHNAKEDARVKLEELKELSGYNEKQEKKEFSKLTQEQKIDYLYSRCFKPTQDPNQEPQYQQPIPDLRRHELEFLYDNHKDKKIAEIITHRDKNADMLRIFDCTPDQIVNNQQELQQAIKDKIEIKAYVGELFPNFFKVLPQNVEHIYTEFPEGKIKQKTIKLGTGLKTKDDFVNAIEQQGGGVGHWAKDIMSKAEFVVSDKETKENLIILSVKLLGFPSGATVKEIFETAKKVGLEFCPPETGPQLRLQYPEHPVNEYCLIGMESITGSGGATNLFSVDRNDDRPWLSAYSGRSDDGYDSDDHFAFVRASNS